MICLWLRPESKGSRGKSNLFDSCALDEGALNEQYQLVRNLFRCLADHGLQVKEEKCHLFCQRVKYCGDILHQRWRSPALEKVAAVCDWTEGLIRTSKQMKGLLGVCNWYSIYIPEYAFLAMTLIDSLKEK